jgi:hypothetical protein
VCSGDALAQATSAHATTTPLTTLSLIGRVEHAARAGSRQT